MAEDGCKLYIITTTGLQVNYTEHRGWHVSLAPLGGNRQNTGAVNSRGMLQKVDMSTLNMSKLIAAVTIIVEVTMMGVYRW